MECCQHYYCILQFGLLRAICRSLFLCQNRFVRHCYALLPTYFVVSLIVPPFFAAWIRSFRNPAPRCSLLGLCCFLPLPYQGPLKSLWCFAWNYRRTESRGIRLLIFYMNVVSTRLVGSRLDGMAFYDMRPTICIYTWWKPRENHPREDRDHFGVSGCLRRKMARACECSSPFMGGRICGAFWWQWF